MTSDLNSVKAFENYLRIEKGRGEKTIKAYINDVKRFRNWLDTKSVMDGLVPAWEEVSSIHIRHYLASLGDPSPSYVQRIAASLTVWFDYLVKVMKTRQDNPAREIGRPKKPHRHPDSLTLEEVQRLIKAAFDESRHSERLRNWTLITVLVNTGLRISELCNMKVSDISHRDGLPHTINIIGKGNKERKIILSENGKTALYQWLKHRRDLLVEMPPFVDRESVWIIPSGKYKGRVITDAAVRKMLKKYAKLAGIQKNVYPHLLRHTFATEAVRNGAKLHALKEVLGHSRLDTTGIYLHADEAELEAVASLLPDILGDAGKLGSSAIK